MLDSDKKVAQVLALNKVFVGGVNKSGTTWMQQIVGQLLFGGDPTLSVAEISPWVDFRLPPKEQKLAELESQTHRRFLKTHLPVDALVFSPKAKYIYIGRDGRDVLWSMYNHHINANQLWYELLNDAPGRVGPPIESPPDDIRQYWRDWLDKDGHPFWPFWQNVRTWWQLKGLDNTLFVHFNQLKDDMPGQMRRIATFLDIPIEDSRWDDIVEYCTFDWMKAHASQSAPAGGAVWEGGAQVFINKGVNGRWTTVLTSDEVAEYEQRANEELGPECARWLATGLG